MNSRPATSDAIGDLDGLLKQFDALSLSEPPSSGYAELMARVVSPEYRRRCGLTCH